MEHMPTVDVSPSISTNESNRVFLHKSLSANRDKLQDAGRFLVNQMAWLSRESVANPQWWIVQGHILTMDRDDFTPWATPARPPWVSLYHSTATTSICQITRFQIKLSVLEFGDLSLIGYSLFYALSAALHCLSTCNITRSLQLATVQTRRELLKIVPHFTADVRNSKSSKKHHQHLRG